MSAEWDGSGTPEAERATRTTLSPLEKISTQEYEYIRDLEDKRRRNELISKRSIEEELKAFRALRVKKLVDDMKGRDLTGEAALNKESFDTGLLGIIKIKRKV
jgi:hypothetical protein